MAEEGKREGWGLGVKGRRIVHEGVVGAYSAGVRLGSGGWVWVRTGDIGAVACEGGLDSLLVSG